MVLNVKHWWRKRCRTMPLVHRDIKRFSSVRDVTHADILTEKDRHCGRYAKSDQVATCLLRRRGYNSALPVRREERLARNRRLLKLCFTVVVLWWVAGWVA